MTFRVEYDLYAAGGRLIPTWVTVSADSPEQAIRRARRGAPRTASFTHATASAASDAPQPGGGDRRPAADGVAGRRDTPHNDIAAGSVREPAA